MWLRTKVLEGRSGDLLIEFETDSKLQRWILEELIENTGISTANPENSLQAFLDVFRWFVHAEFVIVGPV